RLLFIGALAFAQWFRSRKRERLHAGEAYAPFVSILVPAYNEELVIKKTISSLLASSYQNYEIIVIDDGSKDLTSKVVSESYGGDERVRLFTIANGGKANALNFGLNY